MPVWRCPHCGTPQAETSRCWVCRRSTTSCGTCRHFRRGIAGGLGLCGLDPRHLALRGTEMRACWTAPAPLSEGAARHDPVPITAAPLVKAERPRTFVPVDELERVPRDDVAPVAAGSRSDAATERAGWSLWGDVEG